MNTHRRIFAEAQQCHGLAAHGRLSHRHGLRATGATITSVVSKQRRLRNGHLVIDQQHQHRRVARGANIGNLGQL